MRLGTCIALELAVAAGSIGGVWFGVGWASDNASTYFASREASAETAPAIPSAAAAGSLATIEPVPEPTLHVALAEAPRPENVYGAPDAELLAPIAATPVAKVKLNRGGSSLSLRIDFANGSRAAFKPTQTHPQSDPRREIAAYRMDRLLGIGHVPPAKAGAFKVSELVAAAEPGQRGNLAKRIDDEAIAPGDILRGSLSWWIPEIKDGRIEGELLDDPSGMATWARYLQVGAKMPDELRPLLAQISACLLFDVVIDNADRWSGTNTKTSMDDATLYFMDNTLAFSPYTLGHNANLTPLHHVQVFPRALVARLRALTQDDVTAAITTPAADDGSDSGLAPLLDADELRAVIARRDHVIHYIDQLIARYGEDAVLALP